MKSLTRRSVIAGSAAAVTAIPAVTVSKFADQGAPGEDAELRRLWADWLDAKAACIDLQRKQYEARGHAGRETKHLRVEYRFHDVARASPRAKLRWTAVETQHVFFGRSIRYRPIPGTMTRDEAFAFGQRRSDDEIGTYSQVARP